MPARRSLFATALALAPHRIAGAAASRLDQPGTVIALRHAQVPGVGDPSDFVLEDCGTQRNLDARGRNQASTIGDALRRVWLGDAAVYFSRWCRRLETAQRLGLGPVTQLPALDSFFGKPSEREARTRALRDFLVEAGTDWPPPSSSPPTRSTSAP